MSWRKDQIGLLQAQVRPYRCHAKHMVSAQRILTTIISNHMPGTAPGAFVATISSYPPTTLQRVISLSLFCRWVRQRPREVEKPFIQGRKMGEWQSQVIRGSLEPFSFP